MGSRSASHTRHLKDAAFHAQNLRRSLKRAAGSTPDHAQQRTLEQAEQLIQRVQRYAAGQAHRQDRAGRRGEQQAA